jgi:hypothetical protein
VSVEFKKINKILFKLFIFSIFFIYYETKFIPGAIHSWIMFFGLIFAFPMLFNKYFRYSFKIPLDYLFVFIIFILVVLGFFVNYETTDLSNFQAYILMLATYVYVKENVSSDTLEFLSFLIKYFILINGILVIMQLFGSGFYPARYLAAGDPPLIIASGVSDGPTKNGMLISFGLSYMFASLLLVRRSFFSLFDLFIFFIGFISLICATSRAGLFSFLFVIGLGLIFSLVMVLKNRQYKLNIKIIIILFFSIFILLMTVSKLGLNFESLYDLRDPASDRYGLDVMLYKLSVFDDGSTGERLDMIAYFVRYFFESPLNFISIGFGTGSFEKMYGSNIHNSYLELIFTTGFLGFFAFILLIFYIISKALSSNDAIEIIPVLFSLVSVMFFMSTHDVLRGRIFWVALGIISAFAYSSKIRNKFNSISPSGS